MSSFKFVFGLFLGIILSGCGFQPLYQSEAVQIKDETSSIKIATIADRQGQILRNYLLDSLNPSGEPHHPVYRLSVGLDVTGGNYFFRRDSTAGRTIITSRAFFTLTDVESNKILLKDNAEATTAYTVGDHANTSVFPSIVAEKKEIERAMHLLAHEIRLQIVSFLASRPKS